MPRISNAEKARLAQEAAENTDGVNESLEIADYLRPNR